MPDPICDRCGQPADAWAMFAEGPVCADCLAADAGLLVQGVADGMAVEVIEGDPD